MNKSFALVKSRKRKRKYAVKFDFLVIKDMGMFTFLLIIQDFRCSNENSDRSSSAHPDPDL